MSVTKRCDVKVNNQYVKITTAEYYEDMELKMMNGWGGMQALVVKVDKDAREKLELVEHHVKLLLPDDWEYKPLYSGERMTINLSRFCKFYCYTMENGRRKKTVAPRTTDYKQGHYFFTIFVKHLYVGQHRNGEHCSLALQVVEVCYRADKEAIKKESRDSPWGEAPFAANIMPLSD